MQSAGITWFTFWWSNLRKFQQVPPNLSLCYCFSDKTSYLVFSVDIPHQIRRFRAIFVQPIGVNPVCPVYVSQLGGSALFNDFNNRLVVLGDNELHLRAKLLSKIEVFDMLQPEGPKSTHLAEEFSILSVPPRWGPWSRRLIERLRFIMFASLSSPPMLTEQQDNMFPNGECGQTL